MMKRLLFTFLFFITIIPMIQAQSYVQIGTGTESSSMPYTSWSYSWAKALYSGNDLGNTKTINEIGLDAGGSKTLNNQKIYLKTTADTALSGTYEDTASSGYTLVFDGDISVTSGWNSITLDAPFNYNGTDNLIVYWINKHGSAAYASFNATSTNKTIVKVKGSDSAFPEQDGWNPYPLALPNIRFYYESDAPANPSNPQPANNRIKVNIDTSLTFDLGENTTHFHLLFGMNETNLDTIVNDSAVTAPGTFNYDIDTLLNGDTTYYWQVVAIKESTGEEQSSPVWNFKTQGTIDEFPWHMGFEDVWYGVGGDTLSSVINTNYPDSTYWEWTDLSWNLEKSAYNVHSGHFAIKCSATDEGSFYVQTPRILLQENQRISYWWRNRIFYKSKGGDTLFLKITTDGGNSWSTLDTLTAESSMDDYVNEITDLSAFSGNNVYLRWVYNVQYSVNKYVYLDDIVIEENPSGSVIELSENSHNYQDLCVGGKIEHEIIIYNTGVNDLNITGASVTGDFECNYSGTILPGEQDTAIVSFVPSTTGSHNGMIGFVSNAGSGDAEIELTGQAIAPVSSFFQTFDGSDELPFNWDHIDSPDGYISGGGVDIVSGTYDAYSQPNAAKILMANDTVNPLLLITPGVEGYDVNQLTFYAKKADKNYDVEMQVGVMSNPYNASTFIAKKTINLDTIFRKDTIDFKPTTSEPYIAFKHNGDPNGSDDWKSLRIDNISWETVDNSAPNEAENIFPADDTSHVDILNPLSLDWSAGSSNTSGFILYFGSDSVNWEIVNQDTLSENETSYLVETNLDYGKEYFWKIVPFNNNGNAENPEIWSFTTMEDPIITNFPWQENFDQTENTEGYTLPLGWSDQDMNDDNSRWDIWTDNPDYGAEYSHSAPNAMHMGLTLFTAKDDYLYTPPVEMKNHKEYKLSFWWVTPKDPTTGQVYKERMKIFLGQENSDGAMNQELYSDSIETQNYQKDSIYFTPQQNGRHHLGFYAWSDPAQYILMMDDLELVILSPEFVSEPDTTIEVGENYNYSVNCTDYDGDSFEITGEEIPDWLSLTDNGDGTGVLSGTPSNNGEYNVRLKATDGTYYSEQEFTITVTGESMGLEDNTEKGIKVYPNPTQGNITVDIKPDMNCDSYFIHDVTGKTIRKGKVQKDKLYLDLSGLQSGIYYIEFLVQQRKVTKKVILK